MTPSDQSGGRGVRGILSDILHGRDEDQRPDEAGAEGTDREPGRYGAAHPGGPQGEQPPRPRPGPGPDAGAHRLAEQTGGDELFGTSGQEPTFGPRGGTPDGPRAGSNLSWARPGKTKKKKAQTKRDTINQKKKIHESNQI